MGLFNTTTQDTTVQAQEPVAPVEAPVQNPVESPKVEPQVSTPVQEAPVEAQTTEEQTIDRSVYNCPRCNGEGLIDERTICSLCQGTGKI